MSIFESIFLGLVQGLTEFLPVSSSGHLAILQHLFGIDPNNVLFFAAMLHIGTFFSIVIAYFKDIWELIVELFAVMKDLFTGKGIMINKNPTRRLGFMIIVSAIPTAIIGLTLSDYFESLFSKMIVIGVSLIITGTLLWLSERFSGSKKDIYGMRFRDAIFIGLCQSVAITPGISRSGSTIVGGLFSGLNRELTVKFAFLMSIPPVLGAGVLELADAISNGIVGISATTVMLGVGVAFISGYMAIKLMVHVVTNKKLFYFSVYTWIAGLAVVGLSLSGIM